VEAQLLGAGDLLERLAVVVPALIGMKPNLSAIGAGL
jgi:hypothetical protein